jgi:hypothetical protein
MDCWRPSGLGQVLVLVAGITEHPELTGPLVAAMHIRQMVDLEVVREATGLATVVSVLQNLSPSGTPLRRVEIVGIAHA